MVDTIVYEKKNNLLRLAELEDGRLSEIEIIDLNKAAEGTIFLGRITKKIELANGKTGYFVNIGGGREAFINAEEGDLDELKAHEGQETIVQVAQEERAEKGARLTRAIQLAGKYLVYCPYRMNIEISSKIEDKLKAEEYKKLVWENTTGQEGWIIRTSAVNQNKETITEEMEKLRELFDAVRAKARNSKAPETLYARNNVLADAVLHHEETLHKIVANDHNLEEIFSGDFEFVYEAEPFKSYGLEEALSEALQRDVRLKSGGRITIEETRACVAIDVDSGSDTSASGSLGHLNMEAAEEIVRQIRLRNLSGKIVIDFAGHSEYRFLKNVIEYLENELKKDYIRTTVFGLSRAGNVEIVRSRRRPSLRDTLTEECSNCCGTGRVEK